MATEGMANFTDLYQLTMMYGYDKSGKKDDEVIFDLFFRNNPFQNGFTIVAGLEQAIDYLRQLRFTNQDIEYLQSTRLFQDDSFFQLLRDFEFTGDMYAMPEGTVAFPYEPIVRIKARVFEAQLIETALLTMIGFQSLIATKANRVVRAAEGRPVMEFGSRRAQETEAALLGARAAVIGGCVATSNVLAGQRYGISIAGTHSHSWVMSFDSELEAFRAYARSFPDNLILLVDTYDVLKSGVPHAIQVFQEIHKDLGRSPAQFGVRLDSGDLAFLSKQVRIMLDEAEFYQAKIVASNDLDEYLIRDLHSQGAKIDSYGVGTHLITAADQPALGCVYKLAAVKKGGRWVSRIKRSENPEKVTNPGMKKVVRFFDPKTGKAIVDLIMFDDEPIPTQPFEVFDPVHTWKRKIVNQARHLELLVPIFVDGKLVYNKPALNQIKQNVKRNLAMLSDEHVRLTNPHRYHVDFSPKLWKEKMELRNIEAGRTHKAEPDHEMLKNLVTGKDDINTCLTQ